MIRRFSASQQFARERDAAQLIAKVERYETLLDTGLANIRKALTKVKTAAAAAAIVAATIKQAETAAA